MDSSAALTGQIDVAQVVLYVFWIFFAGLILYLRREDKREGYPLVSERSAHVTVQGFPAMPRPKVFTLEDGSRINAPQDEHDPRTIAAEPTASWPGAPLDPVGDPMSSGVGPGSMAVRPDQPETIAGGAPRVRPLRWAREFSVAKGSPDPRGMRVIGADGLVAGSVCDLWVDLAESQLRYLEVELGSLADAGTAGSERRLLPIAISSIDRGGSVSISAILASQFASVPATADPERVTMMEEERIAAYYGAGYLYATPDRREPLV